MEKQNSSEQWFEIGKQYLELGWSIIPIGLDKKPLFPWKPFQEHRATPEELQQWCSNPSLKGFAVVTGKLSGVYVLDIDGGSNFDIESLPSTVHSRTGSGGHHYFFVFPKDEVLRNKGGFQEHTDTRGEGGYAILPPSIHPNGNTYEWISSPFQTPLAVIPDSLIEKLKSPHISVDTKNVSSESIFHGVKESKRNDSATRVIGKLLNRFNQEDWDSEALPLALGWNLRNDPPLSEKELLSTFNSIKQSALQEKDQNSKGSAAEKIVTLVLQSDLELFPNQFNEPCITSPDCSFVAYPLKSKRNDQMLSKMYWDKYHKAPGAKAINDAKSVLEGKALFEKVLPRTLHNRIANHAGDIYYDIGDDEHVVHISSNDWTVETTCPVLFQRYNHQKVQVIPEKGGNLKNFLKFVNVDKKESQLLLLVLLVVSFFPDTPRPILALNGAPGSSKSTLLKFFRELIDPSSVPLVTPPKSITELAQLASHNYSVYFDNLSNMPIWLSDSLCRLVTGDGYSKRELYTDDDDILYAHKRAIGICGINQVANKPDLLDRCVIVTLDLINDSKRREESELWKTFGDEKSKILGAIFDSLVYAIRFAPTLKINSKPRLADSFRYELALAKVLGYTEQDLVFAHSLNAQNQHIEAIDASPVAQVVIAFMENKERWSSTSSDLHCELSVVADELKVKFPKEPNWVWKKIYEVKLDLLSAGIQVERIREAKANRIVLTKIALQPNGGMEVMEASEATNIANSF